jgi:transcriptional regulator
MYIPKQFKETDLNAVKEFIAKHGFAILVSEVEGRPWATHIPLLLGVNEQGQDVLIGHISKANKQWKEFDRDKEVLAIFSGQHAYISSSWYDHENVPTWNYLAVHVYGRIKIIEGDELKRQLGKLVDKYESGMQNPVSVDCMSQDGVAKEMKGIVGFEIEITEVQAVAKLSQNRDEKNHQNIIEGLTQKGDADSLAIAKTMAERSKQKP